MSGDARLTGHITIVPPLIAPELDRYLGFKGPSPDVHVHMEGGFTTPAGTRLLPTEGETNAYRLEEEIREVVSAFPGHDWQGAIHVIWAHGQAQWRYVVRDGVVLRQTPALVWPDDQPAVPVDPEDPADGHDLVITYGDCEFYGRCACGTAFGQPIRPNESLDVLGLRWEKHVMTEVTR